jgi:hypothetical protein
LGVRVDEARAESEREKSSEREKEKRVLMMWWSVACGGDGFRSERVAVERKKKATHFVKREEEGNTFFFFLFLTNAFSFFLFLTFCLVWWSSLIGGNSGPIEFHADPLITHNSLVHWYMCQFTCSSIRICHLLICYTWQIGIGQKQLGMDLLLDLKDVMRLYLKPHSGQGVLMHPFTSSNLY